MSKTKVVDEEITNTDLLEGIQCSCQECPVARALRRAFPGAKFITVGAAKAFVMDANEDVWEANLIKPLANLIEIYDRVGSWGIAPFTFQQTFTWSDYNK